LLKSGLILQIDAWVLNSACQQAKSWQDAGLTPFRIAVNLSANEFTSGLPSKIESVLRQYQISPDWLELEITESMLMHNTESVIAIMEQLVALGVSLALDDFGTGYSSLSYLKRFQSHPSKLTVLLCRASLLMQVTVRLRVQLLLWRTNCS
jgi:EAL domain-containing protein (putative c-di-GMP-specific phosphodiesterase class I)